MEKTKESKMRNKVKKWRGCMNIVSNLNFVCESVSLQNSIILSKKYIQEDHLVQEKLKKLMSLSETD